MNDKHARVLTNCLLPLGAHVDDIVNADSNEYYCVTVTYSIQKNIFTWGVQTNCSSGLME